MNKALDYEQKIWGHHQARSEPDQFNALRLRYAIEDLSSVNGVMLEIGCGGGSMAQAFIDAKLQAEVHACDFSYTAIVDAAKNTHEIDLSVADAYDLPYGTGVLAAVAMFEVLEHLDEPDAVLGEVKWVLAPNGVLSLSVPCEGNPLTLQGILRSAGWRGFELSFGHVQAFSKDSLERLLKEQGFQISSIRWSGHLFSQIAHSAYAVWLRLPGVSASNSVEGRLYAMPEGPVKRLLTAFKSIIARLFFAESVMLNSIPGSTLHISCRKET